jgi:hypothetical protein
MHQLHRWAGHAISLSVLNIAVARGLRRNVIKILTQ